MIATLTGILEETTPLSAVIGIGGVGYEVHAPVTTIERLPPAGQKVKLYTCAVYREDSQKLYGFHNKEDREFFRLLTEKVTGVGPRIALSIMSKLSVATLKNAIASADAALLAKCPGIGKKTAERLVIELKDHIAPGTGAPPPSAGITAAKTPAETTHYQDAVSALITLGYKPNTADKAVRQAMEKLGPAAATEEIIKQALG